MNPYQQKFHRQRGVVLFVSLIMLVVIGLLTLSLMGMTRVEMRMANNEEARVSGLQLSQSLIDVLVANPSMTPVVGGAGYSLCLGNETGCDQYLPGLEDSKVEDAIADGHLSIRATRPDPEFRGVPRELGTSATFSTTSFHLEATYDQTEDGGGYGKIEEGLMVLISTGT
jgi:hypothetical protein